MTNAIRKLVEDLSVEECKRIHAEANTWERTGILPNDSLLRDVTSQWLERHNLRELVSVSIHMLNVTHEVWRRFAAPHLD